MVITCTWKFGELCVPSQSVVAVRSGAISLSSVQSCSKQDFFGTFDVVKTRWYHQLVKLPIADGIQDKYWYAYTRGCQPLWPCPC